MKQFHRLANVGWDTFFLRSVIFFRGSNARCLMCKWIHEGKALLYVTFTSFLMRLTAYFHKLPFHCWALTVVWPVVCVILTLEISRLSYADSAAPDQPAHPLSLTWELYCPLISLWNPTLQISGQCSSPVRLRGCAGWSGAALSAYGNLIRRRKG